MAHAEAPPRHHSGEIILFNYPESVFGRRMVRYLNLRGLPFSQIRVPPNMPRPILQDRLGINYRRIPVMAIGRDVYMDTRLMLAKLETFFPDGRLGATAGFDSAFEDVLEEFIIDGGPFWRAAGCIPPTAPLVQNEAWMKDRSDGSGGQFTREALQSNRAWSTSQLRVYFGMLEKMLSDGRDWILATASPGLAEVHAGWLYDWGTNMASDMRDDSNESTVDMQRVLGCEQFPRVHAWVDRFRKATDDAERANPGAGQIDEGKQAEDDVVDRILRAEYSEQNPIDVDTSDVLQLTHGQEVTVGPVDFGFTHKDEGELVGLSMHEVVIKAKAPNNQGKLRLHYPRINFKIGALS